MKAQMEHDKEDKDTQLKDKDKEVEQAEDAQKAAEHELATTKTKLQLFTTEVYALRKKVRGEKGVAYVCEKCHSR